MTDIPLSNMRIDPADGKYKSGEKELVFIAGDFGAAPTPVYFDDCDKPHGALVRPTSPIIGAYESITAGMKYVRIGGKGFLAARDPDDIANAVADLKNLWVDAGVNFNEFFWSVRYWGDPSYKFIGATVAGGEPVQGQTLFKPDWFTTEGNGSEADQVIPNVDASGFGLKGNSNEIVRPQPASLYNGFPEDVGQFMNMLKPTYFGFYQSGDQSADGAYDAYIEMERVDGIYAGTKNFLADPFDGSATTNYYRKLLFMGQANDPVNGWSNVQLLSDYRYLAVGANSRARMVVSESATRIEAGNYVTVPAFSWTSEGVSRKFTDYERSLGHVHIIESDGTVHENVLELEPV